MLRVADPDHQPQGIGRWLRSLQQPGQGGSGVSECGKGGRGVLRVADPDYQPRGVNRGLRSLQQPGWVFPEPSEDKWWE